MSTQDNANFIASYLKTEGVADAMIIAILLNGYRESRLEPDALQTGSPSGGVGLWQWTNSDTSQSVYDEINEYKTGSVDQKALITFEVQTLLNDDPAQWYWSGGLSWSDWLHNKNGVDWKTAVAEFYDHWERGADRDGDIAKSIGFYSEIIPKLNTDLDVTAVSTGTSDDNEKVKAEKLATFTRYGIKKGTKVKFDGCYRVTNVTSQGNVTACNIGDVNTNIVTRHSEEYNKDFDCIVCQDITPRPWSSQYDKIPIKAVTFIDNCCDKNVVEYNGKTPTPQYFIINGTYEVQQVAPLFIDLAMPIDDDGNTELVRFRHNVISSEVYAITNTTSLG